MRLELIPTEIAEQLDPSTRGYAEGVMRQVIDLNRVRPIIGENTTLTAFLTDFELRHEFGVTGNRELSGREDLLQSALETEFINHNLDAGLGLAVIREEELRQLAPYINRGENPVVGSKSTDLYKPIPTSDGGVMYVNVAEIKLNRVTKQASSLRNVVLRPIVNDESKEPMESLYKMESATSRMGLSERKTYGDEIEENQKLSTGPMIVQPALPTIDVRTGKLTLEKRAPGGHGHAAAIVLHEIANTPQDGTKRVRGIYNGDGPGNFYSPEMIGFTANEAAIVMIVTPTGPGDVKGGKTALKTLPNGRRVPYMLEVAQANEVKQGDIFQNAGQKNAVLPSELEEKHNPEGQYFNTNNVLVSDHFLGPFLQRMREELGEEFYNAALTPEFFPKPDGNFIQLEGAMGSLMLRLNELVSTNEQVERIWEEVGGGRSFLKFINVESEDRDKYFGPIKFPIDFIMQFYSDHFELDLEEWMPVNTRPGHLPHFGGDFIQKNTFYADIWNCRRAFGENSSFKELDSLDVTGKVLFANAFHGGKEVIYSEYDGVVDLNNPHFKALIGTVGGPDGLLDLANKSIHISKFGTITLR